MFKKSFIIVVVTVSLLSTNQALAHATVKPNTVGIGKFQSFTLGVPSEKPIATIAIRLVLPNGLNHVTPNVKPGWKIEVKKQGTGKTVEDHDKSTGEQKITEIIWTRGNIPAEMRDEFMFSAQVPSEPTTLNWKAYQTYADGTIVSWNQDSDAPKLENFGPYSKTEVINDLTLTSTSNYTNTSSKDSKDITAVWLSLAAVIISLAALKKAMKK